MKIISSFLLLFGAQFAWSAEIVEMDIRLIGASCTLYEEDRLDCNGPEEVLPTARIELIDHVNGRQLETWRGVFRKQVEVEGLMFDVNVAVTKRYEKMFKATSYEVSVSTYETGKPLSGANVKVETSDVSVNSVFKNLNQFRVAGPKIVEGNKIRYPHVSVFAL